MSSPLFDKAVDLKIQREYALALPLFAELIAQTPPNSNPLQRAASLVEAGECAYHLGQRDESIAFLEQALTEFEEQTSKNDLLRADCHEILGICQGEKGNFEQELYHKQIALTLRVGEEGKSSSLVAQSHNNLGYCYEQIGNYLQALNHYTEAGNIWSQQLQEQKQLRQQDIQEQKQADLLAACYNNIGNCHNYTGDYDLALHYHQESLRMRTQKGEQFTPAILRLINNIGHDFLQKNEADKALSQFAQVLDLLQHFPKLSLQSVATWTNIGHCHEKMKQVNDARNAYLQAAALLDQLTDAPTHLYVACYLNLISVSMDKAMYHEYTQYCQTAHHFLQKLPETHPYWLHYFSKQAEHHLQIQQYQQAWQYCLQALHLGIPNFDLETPNHTLSNFSNNAGYLLPLFKNGIAALEGNYAENPKIHEKSLFDALKLAQIADKYIVQLRRVYLAEGSQLLLSEKAMALYEKAIQVAFCLKCRYPEQNKYVHILFEFSEHAKSLLLLASLRDADAKLNAGIPHNLVEQEKNIRQTLTYLNKRISQERAKGSAANQNLMRQWQAEHFATYNQAETFVKNLEQNYPEYYRLKYDLNVPSLQSLQQQLLLPQQALLTYFWHQQSAYAIVITHQKVDVIQLPSPNAASIAKFLKSINIMDKRHFLDEAHHIYQQIFEPIELLLETEQVQRLIIIPDNDLCYLPFEALLTKTCTQLDIPYHQLPYLLHRFVVSYHYSATLFHRDHFHKHPKKEKEEEKTQTTNKSLLAFAPVFFEPSPFRPLYSSDTAIQKIGNLFEEKKCQTAVFDQQKATLEAFRKYAPHYNHILLCTHAFFDEQEPENSHIAFSTGSTPNKLLLPDAYDLHLNANLVVLSACETGRGEMRKGEGIMGLNRGFLYSGARNILFTLFKIPDKPTYQLLPIFFEAILDNENYPKALQRAKKRIANETNATPLFWAGMVLIGQR